MQEPAIVTRGHPRRLSVKRLDAALFDLDGALTGSTKALWSGGVAACVRRPETRDDALWHNPSLPDVRAAGDVRRVAGDQTVTIPLARQPALMNSTRSECWIATGAVLGAGLALKALAPAAREAARPWLVASSVLLIAGITMFVVLLRSATAEPGGADDGDAPPSPSTASTALRRAGVLTEAIAAAGLFVWAGAPASVVVPVGLVAGGALMMLIVHEGWFS